MKKLFILTVMSLVLVAMTSCGNRTKETTTDIDSVEVDTMATADTVAIDSTAVDTSLVK